MLQSYRSYPASSPWSANHRLKQGCHCLTAPVSLSFSGLMPLGLVICLSGLAISNRELLLNEILKWSLVGVFENFP